MDNLLGFEPKNERVFKLSVKLKYYNLTLMLVHALNVEQVEVVKEEFYSSLEKVCDAIPNYDVETKLGDFIAKVGRESVLYPACGGHSLYNKTIDDGKRMVNFTLGRDFALTGTLCQHKVTWRSRDNKICNQIYHILIRRHCTNVCYVKRMRGAEIESNHFLRGPKLD